MPMREPYTLLEDLQGLLQERSGFEPGTRRTWGKYEYEKQRDGKWKKVGKAAGSASSSPSDGGPSEKQRVLSNLGPIIKKLPQPPPPEEHVDIAQRAISAHKDSLDEKLNTLKELAPPGADVKGRVKELESAVGKIARKPKYGRPDKLTDITGTRVIVDTIDQVLDTVNKIKQKYQIEEEEDFISKANDGYRSFHIIAKDENGLDFEIQIRTKNQNTWAEWAHPVYKPQTKEQKQAVKDNDEEITKYRLLMSAYFFAKDSPEVPEIDPPPCPPSIKTVFGCM